MPPETAAWAREYFAKGLDFPTVTINVERPRLLVGGALIDLALGRVEAAAQQVSEAQAFTRAKGLRFLGPHVSYAARCVAAAKGEPAEALVHFERADQLALPMAMRPTMWRARAKAAQALARLGREDEAEFRLAAARSTVHDIAGLFRDSDLRERFLEHALSVIGQLDI